jgi:hypothetical protein
MTPCLVPNPPFSTTDHMIGAQTHPIVHHMYLPLPMIPRRSEVRRGAKSTTFAPRIELSPGALGRRNRVTCSAATTSVPSADPSAMPRLARREKSSRFRKILHRAQDTVAQNATQRLEPRIAIARRLQTSIISLRSSINLSSVLSVASCFTSLPRPPSALAHAPAHCGLLWPNPRENQRL